MEAYFKALNEITQEMNSNRGDSSGPEDIVGDVDSVNVGNSLVYDCNSDDDHESDMLEFDGDESDCGDCDDCDERDYTIADDDVDVNSDTVNEDTDSDQNPEDLFIIDDVDERLRIKEYIKGTT